MRAKLVKSHLEARSRPWLIRSGRRSHHMIPWTLTSDLGRGLWFAGGLACEDERHVFPHSGAPGAPSEANLVPRQVVINRSVLSADKQNNLVPAVVGASLHYHPRILLHCVLWSLF
jgi:hypothetical protein